MNKGRKTQDPLPQMLTGGKYIYIYIYQKIALGVRLFSQIRTNSLPFDSMQQRYIMLCRL